MDQYSDSSWTLAVRRRTLKTQRTEERVKQKYKTAYTCPKPTPAMWQTSLPNLDAPAPIRVGWSAEKTLSTLESIPVELRQQIWKSLLTFDGVLHHRLRLLPFLQTGQSYKYREELAEDVRSILPSVRSECAHASLWERHDSGMAVLSLNPRLFSEAIVVFYECNTVEIPAALLCIKRLRQILPDKSDLTLARNVRVVASETCWVDYRTAPFNTLRALNLRCTHLRSVTIDVEDSGHRFMNILFGSKELPTEENIRFTSLGRLKATFVRGISCVVEHGSLVRALAGEYTPYDELGYLKSNACITSWWNSESVEGIIASKRIWHAEHDMQQQHSERWLKIKDSLEPPFSAFQTAYEGTSLGACDVNSTEFWTWLVFKPYAAYFDWTGFDG